MTAPKSLPLPPVGTYVVWGPEKAPEVHLISVELRAILLNRRASSNPHRVRDAVRYVFGAGFTELAAAWDEALLRAIIADAKEQATVRAICATIVIGLPFEEFYKRRGDGGGGQRVLAEPKPVKPQPGGIAVALPA